MLRSDTDKPEVMMVLTGGDKSQISPRIGARTILVIMTALAATLTLGIAAAEVGESEQPADPIVPQDGDPLPVECKISYGIPSGSVWCCLTPGETPESIVPCWYAEYPPE